MAQWHALLPLTTCICAPDPVFSLEAPVCKVVQRNTVQNHQVFQDGIVWGKNKGILLALLPPTKV